MSVSVVLPYMFRSLTLNIFRCIVPVAMLLSALLSSSQLYLGMWLYFLFVLLSCVPSCCSSCCYNKTSSGRVHTTATQTESTATCPDKVVTKTTRRTVALQQGKIPLKMVKVNDRNMQGSTADTDILMF